MWMAKCNLCGHMGALDSTANPWFLEGGKVVRCPKCKKYLVRQEGQAAREFRRWHPTGEVTLPLFRTIA